MNPLKEANAHTNTHTHTHTYTHLDCGRVSVLSFISNSEISVSSVSGLDLLPYLRITGRESVGERPLKTSVKPQKIKCTCRIRLKT